MRIRRSLTYKIIVILFVSLFVVTIGTTYMHDAVLVRYLEGTIEMCAERTSVFSKLALQHGMQLNHAEDIRTTIRALGSAPSIESISVYDKRGRISYASDSARVGVTVDMRSAACVMCHGEGVQTPSIPAEHYSRIYKNERGNRVLGLITPIRNQRSCWEADCHAHHEDQTVLGVLDVQISLAEVDSLVSQGRWYMVLGAFVTFVVLALITWFFVYFSVHVPVRSLIGATKELASGNLEHTVPVEREDELGELGHAFNRMAAELQTAKAELTEWSNSLEEKVERKTNELNMVQSQILHMEKMASLGKLSSMIAHELNNPLAGILTYAKLTGKRLAADEIEREKLEAMRADVQLIADEARRCGDIVKNLLFFARGQSGQYRQADLHDVIEKSIKLVQHNLDLHEINIDVHLPEQPVLVTCDQGQMQQSVLALLMNAIEAMPEGGRLSVRLDSEGADALITVSDTGIGIAPGDQKRIFEPFYTTKEDGHGTGLGLSIVYGIIRAHDGTIAVSSMPGHGATFIIRIPIHGPHTQIRQEA